ncbi:CopL family metal-binding regulatory protein [Pseudoxanthomonas sp. UTMC 1351]|uniref:CopL family metal-binding regulatory protein n=1 Tax=Pseudoxanthomonas sp. UTMC 1351 TaxID=2695853 RepID=UPI0034CDA013
MKLIPRMTRANHLLRLFLIFVLCVSGAVNAWASTHMAMENAAHAAAAANSTVDAAADCEEDNTGDAAKAGNNSGLKHDCDCGGQSACACSCALTFFPDNTPVPFAAQHALASVYAGRLKTLSALHDISPVFRPPIG